MCTVQLNQILELNASIAMAILLAPYIARSFVSSLPKTSRYIRRCHADGRFAKADVQEAIGTRILMLLSGGYPENDRKLSPQIRDAIFQRDGGKCQVCGDPATEIDHVADNSDDPSNLRAICGRCNRSLAWENAATADGVDEQMKEFREVVWNDLVERLIPGPPMRVCDDHEGWGTKWRTLAAQARTTKKREKT